MRNEISASILLDAFIEAIFSSGSHFVVDGSLAAEVGDCVSHESTNLFSPQDLILRCRDSLPGFRLLDFGCGQGAYRDFLEAHGFRWRGVNYRDGMAEPERGVSSVDIDFYDGISLPYEDSSYDVIFSFQVFEHCSNLDAVFSEISRVLSGSGRLIGSVSYLEQVHDYSLSNLTPIGLKYLADRSGLKVRSFYPSYDVFTWMLRRLLVSTSGVDENSLTNTLVAGNRVHDLFVEYGLKRGESIRDINLMRLMFSSHVVFDLEKI